ncbi:YHYH protein [Mesonia phycicola]|uniref:YHYH protein n=1 Tax=Mesonia phycicola TaxID=579105 RepID=A0A1M6E3G6_9FLAO|nr:YHYH protein [Mesonia phycicola]SHI79798.1 YHYH protein [Mesonia phycicola]
MKYLSLTPLLLLLLCTSCGSKKEKEKVTTKEPVEFAEVDFTKSYTINDDTFGTKTSVSLKDNQRVMITNGLPNHSTGEFPNPGNPNSIKAQDLKYSFTTEPKFSGESKWSREPGVAVNGIKFEPETAERFVCETGEVYKIEAIQDLVDLGLDFNLAHVQPTGAYHYHGVPKELIKKLDKGEDIILVGYAKDGFPIYYSKSGKYKPSYVLSEDLRTGDACSYKSPTSSLEKELNNTRPDGIFVSDWTYVEGEGQLDECNGTEINGSYGYFITDEYPYVSRCLKGVFKEEHPDGPPPGAHNHGGARAPHNH